MKRTPWITGLIVGAIAIAVGACGGTSTTNNTTEANATHVLLDSPIAGVTYTCKKPTGEQKTNEKGEFTCDEAPVTFKIGGLVLGTIDDMSRGVIFPQDLLGLPRNNFTDKKLIALLRLLQSLDDDGNISVSINITAETSAKFDTTNETFDDEHLDQYALTAGEGGNPIVLVSTEEAKKHLWKSMKNVMNYMYREYSNIYGKEIYGGHVFDGKTLYVTRCDYRLSADGDKDHDYVGGIKEGKSPYSGFETIATWKFQNGYWVGYGAVGSNGLIQDWGEGAMRYGKNNIGYFTTVITDDKENIAVVYHWMDDNYYWRIDNDDYDASDFEAYDESDIYAFFDTAEEARAYIKKVLSHEQRTCMVK